ncbi:MAG: arabinose operon transcriptional regulator AraC [Saccharospirillum sp.]|uniref:arabinose operon transcriptional regulator AraC n=1 Tax=Saccharospirillum sp. TaxID=2033801 RepID=UPI0032971FD5
MTEAINLDPLMPGYPFNAHLVAGITPIDQGGELDFWIERPSGLKGYILNLTTSGSGLVFPGSKHETRVNTGDMMLIPAGACHDYGRHPDASNWHHRWVYFRPRATWSEWLNWAQVTRNVGFMTIESRERVQLISQLFKDIDSSRKNGNMLSEELGLNLLEQILIRCREFDQQRPQAPLDNRIHRVCQFINDNLSKELSIAELSSVACMSSSRFSHLFRKQLGIPIRQWIEDQRISLARQLLLTTDLAVSQVAQYLGYQDALYFSRVFRKNLGLSPREFRKSHQ